MSARRYKFIESFDKTKIHYLYKKNRKRPIIFLHGLGGGYFAWQPVYSYFYKRGYSILSVDLRGHGYSEKPRSKAEEVIEEDAKDIYEIMKKEKIRKAILVSHSYGTYVATVFYSLFPDNVYSLIYISPNYSQKKLLWTYIGSRFFYILAIIFGAFAREQFYQIDFRKYRGRTDYDLPKIFNEIRKASLKTYLPRLKRIIYFDGENILRKIHVPVLILHGTRDLCVPKEITKRMHDLIEGSSLVYLDGVNHHPPTNCPLKISKIIFEFIEQRGMWGNNSKSKW